MKEIFYLSPHETHKKYDLFVHSHNTTKYGNQSLTLGLGFFKVVFSGSNPHPFYG